MAQERERVWRALAVAAVAMAGFGLPACILGDVDLEGRACPCAEGYGCDLTTNTCVKGDGTSGPASSAASSTTSGGPTSTADVSSASESSAGGSGGAGDGGSGIGGGGAGGDGGAGGAPATTTTTTTGGSGGEGGAPGCPDDQTENVPMCGLFVDAFDGGDFPSGYSLTGAAAAFSDENSRLTITMTSQTAYLAIPNDTFDMLECGITVRMLTAPTATDIFARLSIAPQGQQSRFGIGVVAGTLQVREGDDVVSATDYDPDLHQYLRIRETGGSLYFATSADGVCWDEQHDVESIDTIGLTGRLGIVAAATAVDAFVEYDDYNVLP